MVTVWYHIDGRILTDKKYGRSPDVKLQPSVSSEISFLFWYNHVMLGTREHKLCAAIRSILRKVLFEVIAVALWGGSVRSMWKYRLWVILLHKLEMN